MSDMKCPVCDSYLHKIPVKEAWVCDTHDTKDELYGSKELWQELIRTRRALGIAVDALKELKPQKAKGGGYWAVKSTDAIKLINTALKQITALEQKDVKWT